VAREEEQILSYPFLVSHRSPSALLAGFERLAATNPDQPAFVIDGKATTASELAAQVADIGQYLNPDAPKRIAIALPNSAQVAAWYIASVQFRQTLFLLDNQWPADTFNAAIKLADPHIIVTAQPQSQHQPQTEAGAPVDALEAAVLSHEEVRLEHREPETAVEASWYRDDDFAFLVGFTSGSSGYPKAFLRYAHSWLSSFERSVSEFRLTTDSVQIAPGPLSHGLGFYAMAESLFLGIPFVTQSQFDVTRLVTALNVSANTRLSAQPVNLVVVPTMLFWLVAELQRQQESLEIADTTRFPELELSVVCAGAKLGATIRKRLQMLCPNVHISEYYGASELSFVSVNHQREERPELSVGRLFEGVETIVTDENQQILDSGNTGLLHVKSDMLAAGYLERDLSSSSFNVTPLAGLSPWFTVGDAAKVDDRGNIYLQERQDRMLISGGLNVYPTRVEQLIDALIIKSGSLEPELLVALSACEHKVVCGLRDDQWGDRVCLVLAGHPGSPWKKLKQTLLKECRAILEPHEMPRRLFIANTLPMTRSGKVAYRELEQLLLNPLTDCTYGITEL